MSTTETTTTPASEVDETGTGTVGDELVMRVSDDALATVLGIRGQEDDPDLLALRVEITGSKGAEFAYDLSFEELTAAAEDDLVYEVAPGL